MLASNGLIPNRWHVEICQLFYMLLYQYFDVLLLSEVTDAVHTHLRTHLECSCSVTTVVDPITSYDFFMVVEETGYALLAPARARAVRAADSVDNKIRREQHEQRSS